MALVVALVALVLASATSCAPITLTASISDSTSAGGANGVTVTARSGIGAPASGVSVTFTVDNGATIDGAASDTVTTDAQGLAAVVVTPKLVSCVGLQSFAVTATATAPDGTPIAVTGSPLDVTPVAIPVPCAPRIMVDVTPTTTTPVYANGTDSWTGTITLRDEDSNPVTDAPASAIDMSVEAGVTVSPVANNGDGTYTVLLTSKTPGTYTLTVAYSDDGSAGSSPFTFTAMPS